MIIIGLTGPTGAGKSSLRNTAEDLGFKVIDCDKIARRVTEKGKPALEELSKAFGDDILFGVRGRAKRARSTHIDQEHHRKFALLLIDLDIGLRGACRHVPIDIAHIITRTILPDFGKRHTSPSESSMILSGKDLV